ncbi:MAG: LysM peptidoglycan-binding domain-containing protein [Prolixibacteraceae bacterium]|nr:LysM peptidoglycan-binding domain-containing protein [Prolixibacteraceae bacterium]
MKKIVKLFFLISFISAGIVNAQQNNPENEITGKADTIITHTIEKGETIFSICRQYGCSQRDLLHANPQLISGLKAGETLRIPIQEKEKPEKPPVKEHVSTIDFILYTVKKGETVYSISKMFGIPVGVIYRYNPESEEELLENEIIRLPKEWEKQESPETPVVNEDSLYFYHKIQPSENPFSVAQRYNISIEAISEANTGLLPTFPAGEIIRIPKPLAYSTPDSISESDTKSFMHRVEKGDTFYSYKRRFGVSKEELTALNPVLNEGLKTGLEIRIPLKEEKGEKKKSPAPENSKTYTTKKGDNLYRIAIESNTTVFALKTLNPELKKRDLIAGETIFVPMHVSNISDTIGKPVDETVEEKPRPVVVQYTVPEVTGEPVVTDTVLNDTISISLLLPLFYTINDTINMEPLPEDELAETDSLLELYPELDLPVKRHKKEKTLYNHTRNFLSFYEGFLLAADSLSDENCNVKINLYDTELSAEKINKVLQSGELLGSDLIVGPVDTRLQKNVSAISFKNRIPMVSPFSSENEPIDTNPYYCQVNPSKDYILKKTADFIGDMYYDKNFIIMTLGDVEEHDEQNLVDLVRDKFFLSGIYRQLDNILYTEVDFTEGGNMGYWQVKKTLKHDMENVIFIPAPRQRFEREALLSRAINSLYVFSEEFDITLIGVSDYPVFKSINTEYFHRLNLHYLTPNYIDYSSPEVQSFIKKYKSRFYTEPNQYSFRGYDIAAFFIDAFKEHGQNFKYKLGDYRHPMLQSDFDMQKNNEFSGYMNRTLYIMNYTPDWEVKVISVTGE